MDIGSLFHKTLDYFISARGIRMVGIILFLYGSNYYTTGISWTGVCLIISGFLAEIILKVYEGLLGKKKKRVIIKSHRVLNTFGSGN